MLLAVAVVVVAARLLGTVATRVGQPRVVGEIVAGIVLGPSVLGLVWPGGFDYLFPGEVVDSLLVLAQLGLVMFMFIVGLTFDATALRGMGHRAVLISHASILAPVALGVLLGLWLYPRFPADVDRTAFGLFVGAAMAITAFPVLARILEETGLERTRVGVVSITCAAVDDVTAWCLLAGIVALVGADGPADVARVVALSLLFLLVVLRVVGPLLRRLPTVPLWLTLALALVAAWTTEEIGIHAIFGAFLAGTVVPRSDGLPAAIEGQIRAATVTVLLPVFFAGVGLSTRIDRLDSLYLLGVTVLVVATAVAGKWGGALLAARAAGESWQDATIIGVLLNTRGLTELVILTVGLELGVIGRDVFTIMVVMALVTTMMASPVLDRLVPRDAPGPREPAAPPGSRAPRDAARRPDDGHDRDVRAGEDLRAHAGAGRPGADGRGG